MTVLAALANPVAMLIQAQLKFRKLEIIGERWSAALESWSPLSASGPIAGIDEPRDWTAASEWSKAPAPVLPR